jgi:glycosyltransferase involved in cell wall biosynthesis
MHILFLNPFHAGSHAAVAEGYARQSRHDIQLLTLPIAGGWRWRMRGAAVTFARMLRDLPRHETRDTRHEAQGESPVSSLQSLASSLQSPVFWRKPDLILATDLLDLATFLGLTRDLTAGVPAAVYFHENQLTYPLPPGRTRDLAFPWINYTSALAADALFFNSDFHRCAFLEALPGLIGRYHDHQELDLIDAIARKAQVLPPGVDLARLDLPTTDRRSRIVDLPSSILDPQAPSPAHPLTRSPAVILWNSRWEYDKNPAAFFEALGALESQGIDFRLIVLGEHVDPDEQSFAAARVRFGPRALAWGYAPDAGAYRDLLRQADIVVSTAIQEFFGVGVIEAMYCGCVPILPRRLSYPQILPPEHHAACLYDGPDDLVARLAAAIRDLPALKARGFHDIAARYDWRHMAPKFDAALDQIAGQRR